MRALIDSQEGCVRGGLRVKSVEGLLWRAMADARRVLSGVGLRVKLARLRLRPKAKEVKPQAAKKRWDLDE